MPGCPQRILGLDELKRFLLRRSTPIAARERVWRELATRARRDGPAWVVAAVGMAMPGLRAIAGRLAAGYLGDSDDIDAELVAVFVARLHEIDLEQPKPLARMLWAAERAGRRVRYSDTGTDTLEVDPAGPRAPTRPWDHPDLVLARAVVAAVIDVEEASLIGATRLEGVPVQAVAKRWGISAQVASAWRQKAERRLVEAIRGGELEAVTAGVAAHTGGRAGAGRRAGASRRDVAAGRGVVGGPVPRTGRVG